jgi:hypothetical protein
MIKEFRLKKVGSNLLLLVKAIKFASKLGLKEVKDLVDHVRDGKGPISLKLNLNSDEEKEFLDNLSRADNAVWVYPTTNNIRKVKFAQLGLVNDKQELIDIILNISSLEEILNTLSNKELIDIINKIKPYT